MDTLFTVLFWAVGTQQWTRPTKISDLIDLIFLAGFLNLGTINIWGQMMSHYGRRSCAS